VENILDIKEQRQHRSFKGVKHVLSLKCANNFQLTHFLIRNCPNPMEIGMKLKTAVLFVSKHPINPEVLQGFKVSTDVVEDLRQFLSKADLDQKGQWKVMVNDDKN
jgi:hypothetical protein